MHNVLNDYRNGNMPGQVVLNQAGETLSVYVLGHLFQRLSRPIMPKTNTFILPNDCFPLC